MARPKSTGPELVELANALRFQDDGRRRPLHVIARKLAERGHLTSKGTVFRPAAVRRMLLLDPTANPQSHPHCPVCHAARRPEAS
jgi:hypothetical protein